MAEDNVAKLLLQAVQLMQGGEQESARKTAADEHKELFRSKAKGKGTATETAAVIRKNARRKVTNRTWTHDFVCLSNSLSCEVPKQEDLLNLQRSGLGIRKVTFNAEDGVDAVTEMLEKTYPALRDAGGFEIMVIKRGRQGLVCASVGAMNVSDLRHITTGRIYIRPLQASLPIESDAEVSIECSPTMECITCHSLIAVTAMRQHHRTEHMATENLDCIDSDMEVSQICQDDAADPQQQHISFQLPPGDQSVAKAWLIDMLPTTVVTPTAPPMSSTLQRCARGLHSVVSQTDCLLCTQENEYEQCLISDRRRDQERRTEIEHRSQYETWLESMREHYSMHMPGEPDSGFMVLFVVNGQRITRRFNPADNFQTVVHFLRSMPSSSWQFVMVDQSNRTAISIEEMRPIGDIISNRSCIHVQYEHITPNAENLAQLPPVSQLTAAFIIALDIYCTRCTELETTASVEPSPLLTSQNANAQATDDHFTALISNSDEGNLFEDFAQEHQGMNGTIINPDPVPERPTLQSLLRNFASAIDHCAPKMVVNVDREDVLDGGLRAFSRPAFSASRKLDVKFVGEDGIDGGGLTRDFLRLAVRSLQLSPIFEGDLNARFISLKYTEYDKGTYYIAGKLIGYSVLHGGPGPNFFHNKLFDVMVTGTASVTYADIVDESLRIKVGKISQALDARTYEEACKDLEEMITLAGSLLLTTSIEHKAKLISNLSSFIVLDRSAVARSHFEKGLDEVGILTLMRSHPDLLREIFVYKEQSMTAQTLIDVFTISTWSPVGSNKYRKEKKAVVHWRDFMQDLEDQKQLHLMLRFATGLDQPPPLGFEPSPSLVFAHTDSMPEGDPRIGFPIANTCANILHLPVLEAYNVFKQNMMAAIVFATTFSSE